MFPSESFLAEILGALTLSFLCGFWFLPGGVLALQRRTGELQVDVRPAYHVATLYRLLAAYGPDGVRFFRRMLWADMIFPTVYGALFFVLADLAGSTHAIRPSIQSVTQIAGMSAAGFDYLENLFLLSVVRHLPAQRRTTARLAGICTSSKTASLFVAVFALAGQLASR